MTTVNHAPVGGRTVRVTRINTYGQVVTGACAYATSNGWIQLQLTDNLTTKTTWDIRTGGTGQACLPVRTQPLLNNVDAVIDFVRVEPDLYHLITGETLIYDGAGASVGYAGDTDTYADGSFALELWTGIAGYCPATGLPLYGYRLLPWLVDAFCGAVSHSIGTSTFRMTASTTAGHQWGVGPYLVVADASGAASTLLTPVPATRHRHWQLTTIPPPAVVAGCQTL